MKLRTTIAGTALAMAAGGVVLSTGTANAATRGPCQVQGYTGRDLATCQAFTAYARHPGNRTFRVLAADARRDSTFPAVQYDVALWASDRAHHASCKVLARDEGFVRTDLFTNPDA